MRDWQGRRYWLTGATGTLGRALAGHLSRAGVHLVLSARSEAELSALAADLPGQAEVLPFDLADPGAVEQAVAGLDLPDGIVHLALPGLWREIPRAGDGEEPVSVGLLGAIRLARALIPKMEARGSGHVVLAASPLGRRGRRGAGALGAASAGIVHLAESLRGEARAVRVQILMPGHAAGGSAGAAAQAMFEAMTGDAFRHGHPLMSDWAGRAGRFLPDWLWYRPGGRS